MKQKSLLFWGVLIAIIILSQTGVFAAKKTLFIKGTNITSLTTLVTASNDFIKFYNGGNPMALYMPGSTTLITDFNIASGVVDTKGSTAGRNVEIDCSVGDSLSAIVWKGVVGPGGYYGKTSLAMNQANFDDSALTWNWTNLKVDYKADSPYPPVITQFDETVSTYTDGSPGTATLKVYSVSGTGTDGLREVTGRDWKMWEPADLANPGADEPATALGVNNDVLTRDSSQVTVGKTYAFRVLNKNQWDTTGVWSAIKTHEIAGTTPGDVVTAVYNLTAPDGGIGLNAVSVLHTTPFKVDAVSVSTIGDLVDAINTKAGAKVVTAVGILENNQIQGVYITYDASGVPTYTKTAGFTGSKDTPLARLMQLQISVTKDVTVTFSQ